MRTAPILPRQVKSIRGTRNIGLGSNPALYGNYGATTAQRTIANSNYNALQTNLRYVGKRTTFLLAYTYAKSIDQASNLGEQLNPFDPRLTRVVSSWDMRHNFVATYTYRSSVRTPLPPCKSPYRGMEHFRHNSFCQRLSGDALRRLGQFAARHARQRRE